MRILPTNRRLRRDQARFVLRVFAVMAVLSLIFAALLIGRHVTSSLFTPSW